MLDILEMRRITHLYGSAHFTIPLRGVRGRGFLNPLKKENLWQKSFSDNAEWSSKKL